MESTGVYWKPVYAVLEGGTLEIVVSNAQYVKKVPGRKTDEKDAEWIADLLCHGLLRTASFPPKPIRSDNLQELLGFAPCGAEAPANDLGGSGCHSC
jgi:transposase